MSVAQAGIAWRSSDAHEEFVRTLELIFSDTIEELDNPVLAGFDIRKPGDVMLQTYGDVCFLCNFGLGLRALEDADGETRRVHGLLGEPALSLGFCHDDPRRSYGYALRARGKLVRRRWQRPADAPRRAGGRRHELVVQEQGPPQPFERRWLHAPHFDEHPEGPAGAPERVFYLGEREILVREHELTGRLLQDAMTSLFGVCPWDTLATPAYRFFRALGRDGEPYAFDAERAAPPRRPWWRRWMR